MSFEWLPAVERRREVKTIQATNISSVTRATVLTPTSGTRSNIIDVNIDFKGATANGLELYFDTGANIDSDDDKAILRASQAAIGAVLFKWDDPRNRPRGEADDVLSMRGTDDVAEAVNVLVHYWED